MRSRRHNIAMPNMITLLYFARLRETFGKVSEAIALPEGVADDVARITEIWKTLRARSGGPFLFGAFSAADAMFAPVINRLDVYDIAVDADTEAYMAAMKAHPAWIEWQQAALAETWIVPADEA